MCADAPRPLAFKLLFLPTEADHIPDPSPTPRSSRFGQESSHDRDSQELRAVSLDSAIAIRRRHGSHPQRQEAGPCWASRNSTSWKTLRPRPTMPTPLKRTTATGSTTRNRQTWTTSRPARASSDDPVRMYLMQMGEIPLLQPSGRIDFGPGHRENSDAVSPQHAGQRLHSARRRAIAGEGARRITAAGPHHRSVGDQHARKETDPQAAGPQPGHARQAAQ